VLDVVFALASMIPVFCKSGHDFMSITSLRTDYILIVGELTWTAVRHWVSPVPEVDKQHFTIELNMFMFLLCMMTFGMHTSAVLVFTFTSVLLMGCLSWSFTQVLITPAVLLVFVGVSAVAEYNAALLFYQQQRDELAKDLLLDHATDGFCEIDIATGTVISASLKLEQTLGSSVKLTGKRLSALLQNPDDQLRLQVLLETASGDEYLLPILVTCQASESMEVDVKLVSYVCSRGRLSVCFQTQGEARRVAEAEPQHVRLAPLPAEDEEQGELAADVLGMEDGLVPEAAEVGRDDNMTLLETSSVVDVLSSLAFSVCTEANSIARRRVEHVSIATQTVGTQGVPPLPFAQRDRAPVRLRTRQRVLRQFRETPMSTLSNMILDLMCRVNPRGEGCCYYHIGLEVFYKQYCQMKGLECMPRYSPYSAWQCSVCFALHDFEDDTFCCICHVGCREDNPDEDGKEEQESPATSAWDTESSTEGDDLASPSDMEEIA